MVGLPIPSPAEERQAAVHALAEKVGIVVMSVPYLRQTIEQALASEGRVKEALLDEALKLIAETEAACMEAVALFGELRKVL